jgi:hypothetical protein
MTLLCFCYKNIKVIIDLNAYIYNVSFSSENLKKLEIYS